MATAVAALPHHVAEELRQGVLAVDGDRRPASVACVARRQRHVFFLFQRRVPRTLASLTPR